MGTAPSNHSYDENGELAEYLTPEKAGLTVVLVMMTSSPALPSDKKDRQATNPHHHRRAGKASESSESTSAVHARLLLQHPSEHPLPPGYRCHRPETKYRAPP